MSTKDSTKSAAAPFIKHDVDEAVMLGNAHIDNLMTVVIALGSEIWSGRQRQLVMEALLESKGRVTEEMIEQYVPSDEQKARWEDEREAMVKRVYAAFSRNAARDKPFSHTYEEREKGMSS